MFGTSFEPPKGPDALRDALLLLLHLAGKISTTFWLLVGI